MNANFDALTALRDRQTEAADTQGAYRDLERELIACAPNVPFVGEAAIVGAIPRAMLALKPFDVRLSEVDQAAVQNLGDLLEKARSRVALVDANEDELRRRLVDRKLGLYTAEQEADELGLDLATRVGISPAAAMSTFVTFAKDKVACPGPA